MREFPGIQGFYSVTNFDEVPAWIKEEERGVLETIISESVLEFARLKQDIFVVAKSRIQNFSLSRSKAREDLKGIDGTTIGLAACRTICEKYMDIDADPDLLHYFVRQLDAIGDVVFHSNSDPNNLIILRPEWLGKAIGFVMSDPLLKEGNGNVDHSLLVKVWNQHAAEQGYSSEHYPYFLWLMEKFELTYRVSEERSLIPQLVQNERPIVPFTPQDPFGAHVQCSYQWEVMGTNPPRGLVPILTASLDIFRSSSPEQFNWKNGLYISCPEHGRAYVELRDRVLTLAVRSEYPAYQANEIRKSIESTIQSTWPGVRIDPQYPCGNCLMKGLMPLGNFSVEAYESKSDNFPLICNVCQSETNVGELKRGYRIDFKELLDRSKRMEQITSEMASVLQGVFLRLSNHPNRIVLSEGAKVWQDVGNDVYALTVHCDNPACATSPASYPVKVPKKWLQLTQKLVHITGIIGKGFGLMTPTLKLFEHETLTDLSAIDKNLKFDLPDEQFELVGKTLDATVGKDLDIEQVFDMNEGPKDSQRRFLEYLLETVAKDGRRYGGLSREVHGSKVLWYCEHHTDKKPIMD